MKCLHCDHDIPEAFFIHRSQFKAFKGGRFACPHCRAEHVRRVVGQLPSGDPLYSFRLWGHLTSLTRAPGTPEAEGIERRQMPRTKRWR